MADFDIRFTGKAFTEIGPVFDLDVLVGEQGKTLFGYVIERTQSEVKMTKIS